MKYIVLIFSLFFIFSFNVNAEEDIQFPLEGMGIANSSTKNLIKPGFGPASYVNKQWRLLEDTSSKSYPVLNNFIKVKTNTTYTFSSNRRLNFYYYEFDSEFNEVANYQSFPTYTFTTTSNSSYLLIGAYTTIDLLNNSDNWYQLEEGSEGTEYVAYEENSSTENPDIPSVPTETDSIKIMNDFYSLCINKLNFLANSFSDNFILLSLSVIPIFIFVFLLVFRRYIT